MAICNDCNYATKKQIVDDQQKPVIGKFQYQCRRFPPSAFVVPSPAGFNLASAYPVVTGMDPCSLFEPHDGTGEPDAITSDKAQQKLIALKTGKN